MKYKKAAAFAAAAIFAISGCSESFDEQMMNDILDEAGKYIEIYESSEATARSRETTAAEQETTAGKAETTTSKAETTAEKTTAAAETTAKAETTAEKTTTAAETTEETVDYSYEFSYSFRNDRYLREHFEKHGDEFDFTTEQEYVDGANSVIFSPDALHKTEAEDGDDIYYIEATNEFVVVSKDGYIRTYFKPSRGIAYYYAQ